MILSRAYEIHARALMTHGGPWRMSGIASPFGTPPDMPAHVWRVSPDVLQELYNAMPPPYSATNPKSGDDGTRRLFGWQVDVDQTLPANSMLLERTT